MTSGRISRQTCLFLAALVVAVPRLASAQDALPAKIQVVLFKKIFQYNRALPEGKKPRIAVLEGPGAEEAMNAFSESGFEVALVKEGGTDELARVFFFTKAAPGLKEICGKRKVMSIAGSPEMAERGDVSVALRKKPDGRPEILVNRARAKAEGQDFSADLLGLATVIE
jgi:hypothetical protein